MDSPKYTIDVTGWKMKNFVRFFEAAKNSDFSVLFEMMAGSVKAWPYSHDPALAESFGELDPEQWQDVLEAFSNELTARFQRRGAK